MSVTFEAIDRAALRPFRPDLAVNMHTANAVRLARTLGLDDDGRDITGGGHCAPQQLLERLRRFPDGHPDDYLTTRLGELIKLTLAAIASGNPDIVIVWG